MLNFSTFNFSGQCLNLEIKNLRLESHADPQTSKQVTLGLLQRCSLVMKFGLGGQRAKCKFQYLTLGRFIKVPCRKQKKEWRQQWLLRSRYNGKRNEMCRLFYRSDSLPYVEEELIYDLQRLNNVGDWTRQISQRLVVLEQWFGQNESVQRFTASQRDKKAGICFYSTLCSWDSKSL